MPTQRPTRRNALTERRIADAKYQGTGRSHDIRWDGAMPGFGLRIQPTGRKGWVVFYRTETGRKRLHTLGRWPEMTLYHARKAAREKLTEAQRGGDPAGERLRARGAPTVSELAETYLERHARVHKRTARDDEQRIRDHLKPAWGSWKAETVGRADVARLHRRIGRKAPYAANRTLALVHHLYAWGEREGLLPEDHPNPARGVRRYREESRERWLSPAEVKGLLGALSAEDVYIRAFFWLALLTGCGKGELLAARWRDVDLEAGTLTLRRTKADRWHRVPLSRPARELLAALPREHGNPYVFPGRSPGTHLVNVEKAWQRARDAAGAEGARLHDLRRTVGSWLAQEGASLPIVGAVLNHSNPSTTAIYARLSEHAGRAALEQHGERLVEVVGDPGVAASDAEPGS